MVTNYKILVWKIPWTEEPGGLQPKGSRRTGHDWACMRTCMSATWTTGAQSHWVSWELVSSIPQRNPIHGTGNWGISSPLDSHSVWRLPQEYNIWVLPATLAVARKTLRQGNAKAGDQKSNRLVPEVIRQGDRGGVLISLLLLLLLLSASMWGAWNCGRLRARWVKNVRIRWE